MKVELEELLRLDLQTFAESGDEEGNTEEEESEETPDTSDETENTEEQEDDKRIPYDRFKQKVDEVNDLKNRLALIEEEKEVARREELEEQEKYKELYEEAVQKMAEVQEAEKERSVKGALVEAGYADEQVDVLLRLVEGDTEEEVKESIETLKKTFPIQKTYVDPSIDNGTAKTPKAKDSEEYGKDMFKRLFEKGKLRGFKK